MLWMLLVVLMCCGVKIFVFDMSVLVLCVNLLLFLDDLWMCIEDVLFEEVKKVVFCVVYILSVGFWFVFFLF